MQRDTLIPEICSDWISVVQALERKIFEKLAGVFTPLKLVQWEHMLAHHLDRECVGYILSGIQEGFQIGYERGVHRLGSAKKNMQSAEENPQVVNDYLEAEKK